MVVASVASLALAACKKDAQKPAPAPATASPTTGTVGSDGVRHVAITVDKDGYHPDKILGKAGEKLDLVFTRTFEAECISQLKAPDGKMVDLPMNKPVDVPVTVPASGELGFACGMDMFHGTIVAQP